MSNSDKICLETQLGAIVTDRCHTLPVQQRRVKNETQRKRGEKCHSGKRLSVCTCSVFESDRASERLQVDDRGNMPSEIRSSDRYMRFLLFFWQMLNKKGCHVCREERGGHHDHADKNRSTVYT